MPVTPVATRDGQMEGVVGHTHPHSCLNEMEGAHLLLCKGRVTPSLTGSPGRLGREAPQGSGAEPAVCLPICLISCLLIHQPSNLWLHPAEEAGGNPNASQPKGGWTPESWLDLLRVHCWTREVALAAHLITLVLWQHAQVQQAEQPCTVPEGKCNKSRMLAPTPLAQQLPKGVEAALWSSGGQASVCNYTHPELTAWCKGPACSTRRSGLGRRRTLCLYSSIWGSGKILGRVGKIMGHV